jgi:hypothetical protein
MYRWDPEYPLGKGPLDRIKGSTILEKMTEYALDWQLYDHARFGTEVVTVKEDEDEDGYDPAISNSHGFPVTHQCLHTPGALLSALEAAHCICCFGQLFFHFLEPC